MKRLKIAVLFGGCSPEYRVMLNELSSEEKEECLKILQKTNWTITRIMYTKRTIARQSERLLGEQGLEKAAESKKSADRNDERPRAIWITKRKMRGNSWISAISSHFWTKSLGRLFYQNNLPNMAQRVGFEPTWDCSQTDFESAPLWPLRYRCLFNCSFRTHKTVRKKERIHGENSPRNASAAYPESLEKSSIFERSLPIRGLDFESRLFDHLSNPPYSVALLLYPIAHEKSSANCRFVHI